MSGISWNAGLFNTALVALLVGSPGVVIGGLIGAVAWRGHRIGGAGRGARRELGFRAVAFRMALFRRCRHSMTRRLAAPFYAITHRRGPVVPAEPVNLSLT